MPRITVPVQMRWSDIDGYGHVNNAAMLTLLEEARVTTFWQAGSNPDDDSLPEQPDGDRPGAQDGHDRPTGEGPDVDAVAGVLAGGTDTDTHTLVARQEIEYLAPLTYTQDPVPVQLWIGHLGGASLDVCYEVFTPQGQVCARAATSLVMIDARTGQPRRLTDTERRTLQTLVDEPITFRRR